jgi:outer membrane protein TolC
VLEAFVKKNVVMTAAAVLTITVAASAQTPAPAQPTPPFVTPGPRVDLSIEDAVARARERNIDVSVARITPRLTDFTIAGLDANYRLNLTANTNTQKQSRLPTSTIQGITAITPSYTQGWSSGFAKNMFKGGGNWQVSFTNSRSNQPASNAIRNPSFQSGLSATYVQPLLRGFRIDNTRAQLQTNRISQQNDEIAVQATTATTVANTRNAYWDLVFAIQAVEAAQNSLDISNKLVQDNQARVEIGTLAPIDITSAQAEAANRRLTLVQAQATVRTAELALKRLIVSGTDDPLWNSSINPVDRPAAAPDSLNVEAAVARALRERTDVQQSLNNLKISDINLRNQVDQTRPQLNVTATYGLQGLGGPQIDRTNNTIIPSGYFDALRTIGAFDAPQWNLAASFAYPLGRSAQEATVARSKLALEQTQANLKALQLQIATDVANAALTVQSSLEAVQQSRTARELAQQRLQAAQSKFEVGMATNFEVVQAQRDLADARTTELRNILNYRKALVDFQRSQLAGTSRTVTAIR